MSDDRVARIVAAGDSIEVDGKEFKLRPIPIRHLKELERKALREFKQEYLRTYVETMESLGRNGAIEKRVDEVSRWTLKDLPLIDAYDARNVPVNAWVKEWVAENFPDIEDDADDDRFRSLLNNALDNGRLSPDELKKRTGKGPRHGLVRYDQWWVTASMSGMILFILSSVQVGHPEVTEGDVDNWSISKLAEASRIVERITSSDMGNG